MSETFNTPTRHPDSLVLRLAALSAAGDDPSLIQVAHMLSSAGRVPCTLALGCALLAAGHPPSSLFSSLPTFPMTSTPSNEPGAPNPANDRRIDYIELPATQIAKTKQFYTDAFGWKFTDYGPDYTSFEDGRLSGGFTTDRPVARGVLIVIYAADLAVAEARVRKAGGTIAKPPFSFPRGRRFHFIDPSGNELAVWSER